MAVVQVQIYCRRPSLGETHALLKLGVELIGWHVRPEDGSALVQARQIARLVSETGAKSSLLVHSNKIATLVSAAEMVEPDFLLLSSDRDDGLMPDLAKRVGPRTKLMMSVPVRRAGTDDQLDSVDRANEYADYAGCLILDTCPDATNTKQFGCTGKTNDWAVCASIVSAVPTPVILAGGLNPENVAAGIHAVRPFAVDACTSLEFPDKSKDLERCRSFVKETRAAV